MDPIHAYLKNWAEAEGQYHEAIQMHVDGLIEDLKSGVLQTHADCLSSLYRTAPHDSILADGASAFVVLAVSPNRGAALKVWGMHALSPETTPDQLWQTLAKDAFMADTEDELRKRPEFQQLGDRDGTQEDG